MVRILCAAFVCVGTIPAANAGFMVEGGSFFTRASEDGFGENSMTSNVLPLPLQTTDSVVAPSGNSSASSTYRSCIAGDYASFQFDFSHHMDSDLTANLLSTQSTNEEVLRFTVTGANPLHYSVDGFFDLTGEANDVSMDVSLVDLTNLIETPFGDFPRPVFDSYQRSIDVSGGSFLLGELEGNNGNFLFGSPTGLLMPGVTYGLTYNFYIQDDNSSPVSGTGALNLNISPSAAPEPSSCLLLGIGCCGLFGFGRKRKRRLAESAT